MSNEIDREYIFRIVHLGDSQEFLEILDRNHTLNINIQNEAGESLLIHCVKRLKTKWKAVFGGEFRTICKILIKRNIDVNLQDASGKTAANYAAEFEQLEVLKLLILKGAHLSRAVLDSVIDKEDWILSICASFAKDSELESGANSGQVTRGERVKLKLFHRLLASKYLSTIRWMCELFPEIIEKKNEDSLTALHIVVIQNNVDALNILLEFKTNVEAVDSKGHTALHFAVDNRHIECILSLLVNGSMANCQDVSGATPLHYAINAGSDDDERSDVVVEHLLKYGADSTFADTNGRLALHWAANAGNATICAMMVDNGSPVNSRCNDGHTALHIAASQGHAECIRVLVMECDADINIEDRYGYTPLFNAITSRHIHCAELLLYEDASPNHCNTYGISPAHLAASKGLTEALEVLVKYQGSLELRNNAGDLPIHEAALFEQQGAVNYILRCQCDANARNKQGFTPLHLAASVGSIHVCQCLMEGGANINCVNTQYRNEIYKFLTPLDLAKLNKHSECVEYLEDNGGFRGDEITKLACRKIQRWWRRHGAPKTTLDPVEYPNDCLKESEGATCLEITQRASEDDTKCLTKTQDTDEQREHNISEHKNDNGLQQVESSTSERRRTLSNSSENIPIGINAVETKGLRVPGVHSNELKTRSSKNSKNKAQKQSHEMLDDLHKSKSKTSPVNKAAVGPGKYTRCVKNPTRKSPSTARNATVKETRHALKTKTPGDNRKLSSASLKQAEGMEGMQETSKQATAKQERPYTLRQTEYDVKPSSISRKQAEGREDIQTCSKVTTSNLEIPCTTKEDLKRSLDEEVLRKEKLSKEIARLKKNLEERSQSLEMRLGVIEKNLKKL